MLRRTQAGLFRFVVLIVFGVFVRQIILNYKQCVSIQHPAKVCGWCILDSEGPEQLFDFLRRREVCGAVDVRLRLFFSIVAVYDWGSHSCAMYQHFRFSRPTRAAAALRRFAVSQGLDWEWRPALAATGAGERSRGSLRGTASVLLLPGSTGAEAAERAAVLVRLAKAAWTKHQNGGRQCSSPVWKDRKG